MPPSSSAAQATRLRLGAFICLVMGLALMAAAQQPEDAESVLRRTRERLLADLQRFPRYTCVQTITRQYYRPSSQGVSCASLMAAHNDNPPDKLRLRGWDRLRLEVAISGRENVYSWVGAPRFESGTIEQLAGGGPFNTGDFGPFLSAIFDRGSLHFVGEEDVDSQRALAYSYEVPLEESTYTVKTGDRWVPTAYSGKLFLNPLTADIIRLTVSTTELPETNPDCQAISQIDYGRTEIHDRMVLIPRQTALITLGRDGNETESNTIYSSCREFASKTRMLIDPQSASSTAGSIDRAAGFAVAGTNPGSRPTAGSQALDALAAIPGGLHLRVRIITLIDSDTAAAGDPIEAVLRSPLRDRSHRLLAPAGTRLHGRLLDLEKRFGYFEYFRLTIQFESLDLNGHSVALRASPDLSVPPSHTSRPSISVMNDADANLYPHAATNRVFIITHQHLHLGKLDWGWTTTDLNENHETNHDSAH